MSGPRQHYLAAAYLAGFSAAPAARLRKSSLWVGRRGVAEPYRCRAEAVAYKKNLYDLSDSLGSDGQDNGRDGGSLDETWTPVERRAGYAIAALRRSCTIPLPAEVWLSVLVPFAAQVFVRGADWIPRFVHRFAGLRGQDEDFDELASSTDNANVARLIELRRLLAPMMAARWRVLYCPERDLIVNDVGRLPTVHVNGEQGYTIPLNRRVALALIRAESGPRVAWSEEHTGWFVEGIEHFDLTARDVDELNAALRASALVECYGSAAALVRGDMDGSPRDPTKDPFFEPHLLLPPLDWLRSHEDSWPRMMTIISRAPRDADEDQPWAVMAELAPEESSLRAGLHELLLQPEP
jgi:hypothetical protein